MHREVAGAYGQVAGHRRRPASSAPDPFQRACSDYGHRWDLQVGVHQLQAWSDQRGDGQQGAALPHPPLHREWSHRGSVQHGHQLDQRDDGQG